MACSTLDRIDVIPVCPDSMMPPRECSRLPAIEEIKPNADHADEHEQYS
jgi:hypothetical protein